MIGVSVASTEKIQGLPFNVAHVKYLQRVQFLRGFRHDLRKSRSVPSTGVSGHALRL